MSENIPTSSNDHNNGIPAPSPPPPPPPSLRHRKSRKKIDKAKLPTPPPDPMKNKTSEDKDDFLAYLDALQKSNALNYSRSTSVFAPVIATEDAFDHLEKLYKLMEQMLELREQNARLHRKVRDLEHFNNLEKMHKQLDAALVQGHCPELDKDTAFAETILESILSETKGLKQKPSASSRLRQSISRRPRNRSGSVSIAVLEHEQTKADRRASTCVDNRPSDKQSKVSKWTKVKAAFKWEKASPTVGDAKSQDSGIGGMMPVNLEVARYLRVPSTSEDGTGHSPADSGAAEISTPGTLSTTSSTDDFQRQHDLRSPCEDLCSDDEHPHNYIPQTKDGSQKSTKSHKTPWAKMKDMIQTRNSFKKKHRLSTHSDEIQIDVELCSDNEDNVFDDDDKKSSLNPSPQPRIYTRLDSSEVPPEIVARYQKMAAEDGTVLDSADSKKISKWTRVKKAFLTPSETSDASPCHHQKDYLRAEDDSRSVQAEIQRNYKQLQQKLSLEFQEKLSEWDRVKQNSPGTSNPSSSCGFVDENRDQAFIKKMEEWERIKSQPSVKLRPNIQITSEEHLPPEFRKKLQEWEKIRKGSGKEASTKKKLAEVPRWKSLSGPKCENSPPAEYPQLSDDFRRKLEEWKQIKSGGATPNSEDSEKKSKELNKPSSPRLTRKNSSPKHSKKQKDSHDKELQWFEKELGKIEKEKQRLERERQKFLEREATSSKVKPPVGGGPKKEIFVHTPSGFYRFEGISRKFAQKLYEWEKAQGIGPESSTFALLNSSIIQDNSAPTTNSAISPSLVRSKSADSIAISALSLTCPLMSQQPSSLSLNDMEDLEKECLADSKSSSIQYITRSRQNLELDEPEAIIVEVEDIIEETAAPLRTFAQKVQQPVYQRQELKTMCEGETCAAPKIRRNESAKAQNSYNLIEEVLNVLKNLAENESEIYKIQDDIVEGNQSNANLIRLKTYDESQKAMAYCLSNKIARLQETNSNIFSLSSIKDSQCNVGCTNEILEAVQDISLEVSQQVERLNFEMDVRDVYNNESPGETGASSMTPILEIIKDLRGRTLELRRCLSYMCAASDLTAPGKKYKRKNVKKSISNESHDSKTGHSDSSRKGSDKLTREGRIYIKSDTSNTQSQGAIKKRIRYRQKNLQSKTLADSDDEEEAIQSKKNAHRRLSRSRSVSDNNENDNCPEMSTVGDAVIVDESILEKVVVPTKTNYLSISPTPPEELLDKASDSPVTIFVKTTRKLFTPIAESTSITTKKELSNNSDLEKSPSKKEIQKLPDVCVEISPTSNATKEDKSEVSSSDTISEKISSDSHGTAVTRLPPLPSSPTPQRKVTKEISPSIKVMLARYNQKISEQDTPNCKSGASSGSVSPVAWRSPSAERRVRTQTERYQEGLNKLSPLLNTRREVQKSASVGFLSPDKRQFLRRDSVPHTSANNNNGQAERISKSSSASVITSLPEEESTTANKTDSKSDKRLKIMIPASSSASIQHSPDIRLKKLQQAKEEFLKSSPSSAPCSAGDTIKFPSRNRLSQISVDSESSFDSTCTGTLIKSASAGMINIDADVYRQIDPEIHGGGYVSLPRSTKKPFLGGKFAFSSIASKFRKVKMRKGKDKMNAVSTLCRQSLVVDINRTVSLGEGNRNESSSCELREDQRALSKSASWIKKSKLFKK